MSRFFVTPDKVGEKSIIIDDAGDLRHMSKALRLSVGDEIDVSDSTEWEYSARLISIDADAAEAEITDKRRFAAEPRIRVTLFQGIPKQGKMETVVQKSVELGVNRIVPVFMDRTVVADRGNFAKKLLRWQKVSDEAVKQCGRGRIPEIGDPVGTEEAAGEFKNFDLALFPYENEKGRTIKDALRAADDDVRDVAVIIGPEGGFSEAEARTVEEAGGIPVSLGRTVLRTETAGPAALAMIMYELEL